MSRYSGKTLWQGTAWTLASGAVLYLFTPLGRAGASGVVALLVMAVGWALIGRAPSGPAKTVTAVKRDSERLLMGEFSHLLNVCVRQFAAQYDAIQGEIAHVQTLLSEAISSLTQSFHGIHEQTEVQRRLTLALTGTAEGTGMATGCDAFVTDTSEAICSLDVSAHEVEALVGKVVTSLQFQDIVSQLTAHVMRRVEALAAVARHLGELAQVLRSAADADDAPAAIAALKRETEKVATSLAAMEIKTIHNPVGQQAMSQGEVELF